MRKLLPLILLTGCTAIPTPPHSIEVDYSDNKRVKSIQLYTKVDESCLVGKDPSPPIKEYLQDYLLFDTYNTEYGAKFTNIRRSYIQGDHYSGRREVPLRYWKTHNVSSKVRLLQQWIDSCNSKGN